MLRWTKLRPSCTYTLRNNQMVRRVLILVLSVGTFYCPSEDRPEIYPLDRATILANSRFDIKVEFPTVVSREAIRVEINGKNLEEIIGKSFTYIEKERYQPPVTKAAQAEADELAARNKEKNKDENGEDSDSGHAQLINPRDGSAVIARIDQLR